MRYYIKNEIKNDYYLLGHLTPTGFTEGHGLKFIKEYLGDFPFLLNEISVTDELDQIIPFVEFFDKIKN